MPSELPSGWPEGFGAGRAERRALAALASLRGITPGGLRALAWDAGSARTCVQAIRARRAGSEADTQRLDRIDPDAVLRATEAARAVLIAPRDPNYPSELNDLSHDPPGWLFVRGRPLEPGQARVAVVGSRRCSALGREVAHDIGRRLAGAGVAVVSGAAAGIDGAAHRGALVAAGPTVAVLGSGIDVPYPRSHAELIERIADSGTLVGEYPPGVTAEPYHFPSRNRIIAALARAVVVVEGAAKSGSKISVDHALDLGREVFAVPGPVTSPLSETPLAFIRDGATMIRGADDLLSDLGIGGRLAVSAPPDLPPAEGRVWDAIAEPCLPETVARRAGLSIPDALSTLVSLEIKGLIRVSGGRYERTLGSREAPGSSLHRPPTAAT